MGILWGHSGRSPAKNEELLSITSETTFGLLLPTVAAGVSDTVYRALCTIAGSEAGL